jgi:glycosyltransferase involved in cell wall biosynthesis
MISIIYCTRTSNEEHKKHLIKTSGLHNRLEVIEIVNNGESLTSAYNRGLSVASNNIVVFCHDDLTIETNQWGNKLLKIFERNLDFGIVGVAGTKFMSSSGRWWDDMKKMYGKVSHTHNGKTWLSSYSQDLGNNLEEVVVVDGLFFAIDKNRIQKTFNEEFKGFHFYDVSFCFDNFLSGVKIGVTTEIRINHKSIGMTNSKWEENRIKFSSKYESNLPIFLKRKIHPNEKLKILVSTTNFNGDSDKEKFILQFLKVLKNKGHHLYLCSNLGNKLTSLAKREGINLASLNEPFGFKVGDGKWQINTPNGPQPTQTNQLYKIKETDFDIIQMFDDELTDFIQKCYPTTPIETFELIGDDKFSFSLDWFKNPEHIDNIINKYEKNITELVSEQFKQETYQKSLKNLTEKYVNNLGPLVSIIIPCFNDGQYLPEAIKSAKELMYSNKEIIVINDGSSDKKTLEILNNLDGDIKVLHHEKNKGLPAARNTGIKFSQGYYILPHDVDDTFDKNYLLFAIDEAEKSEDLSPIYCDTNHIGFIQGMEKRPEWSLSRLKRGPFIVSCSLFRKKAWEYVSGYDESMKGWEDYDFWWRIGNNGYRGIRIPLPLFNYRHIRPSMIQDIKNDEKKLYDYIMNKPLSK